MPNPALHSAASRLPLSEAELVSRIAAGDEQAFGELYHATRARAFALAMSLLQDSSDAEEAVSDAFAQVWRNAAAFRRHRGSVQAWLTSVVRSRALDGLRARRRLERVVLGPSVMARDFHAAAEDASPTPDVATEGADQGQRIMAAVAALTQAQQETLRLAFFDGLSHSEIAARLREPLGTVKTRMRTALHRLRAMLKPLRTHGER